MYLKVYEPRPNEHERKTPDAMQKTKIKVQTTKMADQRPRYHDTSKEVGECYSIEN